MSKKFKKFAINIPNVDKIQTHHTQFPYYYSTAITTNTNTNAHSHTHAISTKWYEYPSPSSHPEWNKIFKKKMGLTVSIVKDEVNMSGDFQVHINLDTMTIELSDVNHSIFKTSLSPDIVDTVLERLTLPEPNPTDMLWV